MANKRKCKYCLEYFPPEKIKRFGVGYFCSIEHALQWVKEKQAKDKARKLAREKKAVKEKQVKEKKEFKANDLRHQLKVTQPVFNKWRRLNELKWFKDRGLEPTCISCNKPNMDWCCGHLKTVGSQSALRFDVLNTYLQCNRYCNKGLSGNISGNKNTRGYLQGLRDRFGQERAKEIIEYCEVDRVVNWDCDELIAMRKMFNAEIRELKIYLEM